MTLRPESSVTCALNEYGELEFACDRPGPVVHRTPEELGIPRVVPDIPARKEVSTYIERTTGPRSVARREVDRPRTMETQLASLRVDQLTSKESENDMPKNNGRVPEDIRAKILAEPVTMSNSEIGEKYGISGGTAWWIRKQAGIHSKAQPGRSGKAPAATSAKKLAARPVEIDPHAPGSAAALVKALNKADASAATVTLEIELSHAQIAKYIESLDPVQRVAFLAAGMKAALLA